MFYLSWIKKKLVKRNPRLESGGRVCRGRSHAHTRSRALQEVLGCDTLPSSDHLLVKESPLRARGLARRSPSL